MKRGFCTTLVAGFLCTPLIAAGEEDTFDDDTSMRCINIGQILRTKVVDDSNVVFFMRNDEMLLNTLRSRCSGLARRGRFAYKINSRSLCELNRITVIEGGSFSEPLGRSCSLGRFRPVTMEDLARRFAPVDPILRREEVETPPVEDVLVDDTKEADPDIE